MFLIFNSARTSNAAPADGRAIVPPHGSTGPGHVAFRVPEVSFPAWRARIAEAGISIEADIAWPGGGRSLYIRDPAGNSVELASARIWGLTET
jgi:catechol 2,3-dioxygenase-like lactoylglutathione lyase family enzyme